MCFQPAARLVSELGSPLEAALCSGSITAVARDGYLESFILTMEILMFLCSASDCESSASLSALRKQDHHKFSLFYLPGHFEQLACSLKSFFFKGEGDQFTKDRGELGVPQLDWLLAWVNIKWLLLLSSSWDLHSWITINVDQWSQEEILAQYPPGAAEKCCVNHLQSRSNVLRTSPCTNMQVCCSIILKIYVFIFHLNEETHKEDTDLLLFQYQTVAEYP